VSNSLERADATCNTDLEAASIVCAAAGGRGRKNERRPMPRATDVFEVIWTTPNRV
jgi:hypothetical protein